MAERGQIRVALTPTGVAEVVRALRQVQKEAGDANRNTSGLLREIKGLLPTLGFAAVVTGFAAIVKGAADFADRIDEARQRTGDTAEDLSALAFQARLSGIQFDELESTLARTARAVQEFRNGTAQQSEAFRDLNLSVADFEGLGAVRSFDLISQRLLEVEDSTKRAALAQDLFGRSGARLLTLVEDLGERGFAAVARDAEAAGAVISTELALAAAAANDSLDAMGILVQSLALQFVSGFAPQVNTALTQFREDVQGKGVEPMREFGEIAGRAFRIIVAGARFIGTGVASAFDIVGKAIGGVITQVEGFLTGGFEGFKRAREAVAEGLSEAVDQASKDIEDARIGLLDAFDSKPIEIKVAPRVDRQAVDESAADAQQQIRTRLANLEKQLDTGDVKAAEESIKRRRELAEEALKLDQERAEAALALQQNTLQGQRALAAVETQILTERTRIITQSFQQEQALIQQRAAALSAAAQKQFGDNRASAQLQTEIERQSRADQLALAQRHFQELARLQADYLTRYRASSEAIKAIDQEIADNRLQRERTFRDIARSRLSEAEQFNDRIRESEENLSKLRAAVLAGDLDKARKLRQEIAGLATEIARAQGAGVDSNAAERIGKRLFEDADALLELALAQKRQAERANQVTAQQGAKSLADQLATVQQQLKTLEAQQLKPIELKLAVNNESMSQLVRDINDRLQKERFNINLQPQLAQAGTPAPGFASGGPIAGYAPHPRADNVLIRATPGEFVQQVAAVRHYGLDFMRDVNALRFPRFADGGLVDGIRAANDDPLDQAGLETVNLQVNGRPVGTLRGPRARIRQLERDLQEVSRGTLGR